MFVHKNLVTQADSMRRNNVLKSLALFFLGASAVLLFTKADLVLNPYISNSFVYLQKMYFSPNGTTNTIATITLDWWSGHIEATTIDATTILATNIDASVLTSAVASIPVLKTNNVCDSTQNNCFNPSVVSSLSGDVSSLTGRLAALESLVDGLSDQVGTLEEEAALN